MSSQFNTIPIQQFIQQVKSADLSNQKEIKLDIKTAKNLAYCINELNSKLVENYETVLEKIINSQSLNSVSVQMDGGDL